MSLPPHELRILLTGATGFIGGTVLYHLLSAPALQGIDTITCLVRNESAATKLISNYGARVTPVLFESVDDTDFIADIAAKHDIVVNMLIGYHPGSARALVEGLGRRRQATGRPAYVIQTSGTSNLADRHITEQKYADRIFYDDSTDVYGFEQAENERLAYPQRTAELGLIDVGIELGVRTLVIMSPLIYGIGTGTGHRASIQIPWYITATLRDGQGVLIEDGQNQWGYVHVVDLAQLYELALLDFMTGAQKLPTGKQGIIFSATGEFKWIEVAQGVADAAAKLGKIKSNELRQVDLAEGARTLPGGDEVGVEMAASSNARTRAVIAEKVLGWRPVKGADDWRLNFEEELREFWMDYQS